MARGISRTDLDPRVIAVVAMLVALSAIALEIAYAIGNFVTGVVHQLP